MQDVDDQELRPVRAALPLATFERLMEFARAAGDTVDGAAAYAIVTGLQVLDAVAEGARKDQGLQ